MKSTIKKISGLLALGVLATSIHASVLLQENFTYTNGNLTTVSSPNWVAFSGGGTLPVQVGSAVATFTNGPTSGSGEDLQRLIPGQPFTSGNLYMSALISISNAPTSASGDYFLSLYSTNGTGGGFSSRIFASTITGGGWSFGNTNNGTAPVDDPTARSTATWYKLIVKYDVSAKSSIFGVFAANYVPADDSELTVIPPGNGGGPVNVTSVAIRQGAAANGVWKGAVNYILVGDTLADVAGNNLVPPAVALQPSDTTGFVGGTASFSTVAVGEAGDAPLTYQWFYNTNTPLVESSSVIGTTSNVLTLTNLTLVKAGTYSCIVSNAGGTNVTRYALLSVSLQPVPPVIDTNIAPSISTNFIGDILALTVGAHGLPTPAYIWKFIPDTNTTVTNIISTGVVSDANGSTLTLSFSTTNQSGKYFVTITNSTSYFTTNSAQAIVKVKPTPTISIATLRSLVDGGFLPLNTNAYYTVQGTVTTWTNLTTSATDSLFYMQDGTGGIPVFWAGADFTNHLPTAGSVVRATGPLTSFTGLLELKPVFTNALNEVTVISTGNPLPPAQPLPFDPNVTGNLALMKTMEGTYFVASNVFLANGATFTSSSNEGITNILGGVKANTVENLLYTNLAGQSFVLFVNSATDIKTQPKPSGPVTIYGVLGYFNTIGFEFTPTRYADIISYVHITNIVSHARPGDLPTNSYSEMVLRSGETLKTYVNIGDAAGGTVTLAPVTDGLSANSSWSGITSGLNAQGVFTFTPQAADAGSNYLIQLYVTSTTGTAYTNTFSVYVPTLFEQKIAISEFLANPVSSGSYFNPLARSTDTIGISTNDQYLEIVNTSDTELPPGWKVDEGTISKPVFDSLGGSGTTLSSFSSVVIYGGNLAEGVGLSTPAAVSGTGLFLPKTGTGTIVLRNNGLLIDRVVYSAADLSTNGSLSRFPTINNAFAPQTYISTNLTTAGVQYDGSTWDLPPQIPVGVDNVLITITNKQAVFNFTATSGQVSTLWQAGSLTDLSTFKVVNGKYFPATTGILTMTNLPPDQQFYYISTLVPPVNN